MRWVSPDERRRRRIPFPEVPDGPPARVLSGGAGRVVGVCGGQALFLDQAGRPVGPFPVPDDVVGFVPRGGWDGRPATVGDGPSYLARRDGRLVRINLAEPGRSRELPAEVVGVRSVQRVFAPSVQVITRPDEKMVRYWSAGLGLSPRGEDRFATAVLHAGPWAAVAADGEIAFPPQPGAGPNPRGHVAGGPFLSAHEVGAGGFGGILLLAEGGKPVLIQQPVTPPGGAPPKERFAALPLAGTVPEPILEATRLVGRTGRPDEPFVAARTAGAAYLWKTATPNQPPRRFPPAGQARRVAFCQTNSHGSFVLTEDERGITLWEVGGDGPVLTVPGTFDQVVPHPSWPAFALLRAGGPVALHSLSLDTSRGEWRARDAVAWDVKSRLVGYLPSIQPGLAGFVAGGSSMPTLSCPHCGRLLRLPTARLGKRSRCPDCEHSFVAAPSARRERGEQLRQQRGASLAERKTAAKVGALPADTPGRGKRLPEERPGPPTEQPAAEESRRPRKHPGAGQQSPPERSRP